MFEILKPAVERLEVEIRIFRLALQDGRTPSLARLLLGLALAYALSPLDLIPDFVPILGQLDDLIIVPALLILALKLVPKEVLEDCRAKIVAEETETISAQVVD